MDEGLGGGGGGGGSSLVPSGGRLAITLDGSPRVTLTWSDPPVSTLPNVAIATPGDGATYEKDQVVVAAYQCTPSGATTITACSGIEASGSAIDTSAPDSHTFTVLATNSKGEQAERTVTYTVVDTRTPFISGLGLDPRAIVLGAPRAGTTVTFSLSEDADVVVRIDRVRGRRGGRGRGRRRARASRAVRVLRLDGIAGRNRLRLRARSGRRMLRPGVYRLILVATDDGGNRSRPATRRFSVVE